MSGAAAERRSIPWVLVGAGIAVVFLSMGTRQSFGIFLTAVTEELGTGREAYSLAVAVQNLLMGIPIAALIADRIGHRKVLITGAAIYGVAMLAVAQVEAPLGLFLSLGLLAGVGLSALSLAVVIGAVGRLVPVRHRAKLLGLITAGTSLGMFLLVPAAQQSLDQLGWRPSFQIIAVMAVGIIGLAFLFPASAARSELDSEDVTDEAFLTVLQRAKQNRSYLLLIAGFFVCGFHVGFIATHLPAFLADEGVGTTAASLALAMIGLMNIVGATMFGVLGDRYRKRTLLAILYGTRAVLMTLLLLVPLTSVTAVLFGSLIGLVWLATAPLTSATVATILGSRYLTTLYGVVFLGHQVGAFLGVWLGGRLFDATGSYEPVWIIAILLGIAAMLIHLPIDDRPRTAETALPQAG